MSSKLCLSKIISLENYSSLRLLCGTFYNDIFSTKDFMSNDIIRFVFGARRRRDVVAAKLRGGASKLTVTPSKLVFLRASRKSFSHNTSLYRKSDIVWLRWKCRILRATCFTANATVQIPSYVYPWNLEYSAPRLELYSS